MIIPYAKESAERNLLRSELQDLEIARMKLWHPDDERYLSLDDFDDIKTMAEVWKGLKEGKTSSTPALRQIIEDLESSLFATITASILHVAELASQSRLTVEDDNHRYVENSMKLLEELGKRCPKRWGAMIAEVKGIGNATLIALNSQSQETFS
jgi:hypothetical protein